MSKNILSGARSAAAAVALLLSAAAALSAQTNVIFLWPNGAPGSENWTQKEISYVSKTSGQTEIRNVVKPSITAYLPPEAQATGTAVIVAPGGAFRVLAWEGEGMLVAEWLKAHGIAAFLLKYRLVDTGTPEEFAAAEAAMGAGRGGRGAGPAGAPGRGAEAGRGAAPAAAPGRGAETGRGPAPAGGPGRGAPVRGGIPSMDDPVVAMSAIDARKAIEIVRTRAAEFHVDPAKIGIIGFSAGGWASVMTGLQHTAADRPNFVAGIYACCLNTNNTLNASTIKVPDDAPPAFFLNAADDFISSSTPALFQAWRAANKPAEVHTFVSGGHGFEMRIHDRPTDNWIELFAKWLKYEKLLK